MSQPAQPARPTGGKYSKRHCPALQSVITPSECGSQRGSKLNCPPTCRFYPFAPAGYELHLRLESDWLNKVFDRVSHLVPLARFDEVARQCSPSNEAELREPAMLAALHRCLFMNRGADGRTLADAWEAAGWTGLNNDERQMCQYRRQARPTVIEVQRVVDAQSLECLDLLAPEQPRFVVFDRGLVGQVVRFSRLLGWLIPYPHYHRLLPGPVLIPSETWSDWRSGLLDQYGQARQADPELKLKDFLAGAQGRMLDLMLQLGEDHRQRMIASLDFHHCVGAYRLAVPASEIEALLRGKPDFEPEPPGHPDSSALARFVWLRRGDSARYDQEKPEGASLRLDASIDGVGTLGNLQLFSDRLVFEAFAKSKYDFGRRQLESYLGDRVSFAGEQIRNMAEMLNERDQHAALVDPAEEAVYGEDDDEAFDEESDPVELSESDAPSELDADAPLPPPTAEQRRLLQEHHEGHYRTFVDQPTPALGGLTPRVAARDPQTRLLLLELMKNHIHGLETRNRDEGLNLQIDDLLRELGLHELL